MISSVVVLLAVIGFLCVRNEYVQRRFPFLLSIALWGTARILMELNFQQEPTGQLEYNRTSAAAATAATCLVLCVFCLFWACYRPHPREAASLAPGAGSGSNARPNGADQDSPEERIRRLVDEVDAPPEKNHAR